MNVKTKVKGRTFLNKEGKGNYHETPVRGSRLIAGV